MELSAPIERLYAPLVAFWWLGMVTCFHLWAGFAAPVRPPRGHLRLVANNGKLIEQV